MPVIPIAFLSLEFLNSFYQYFASVLVLVILYVFQCSHARSYPSIMEPVLSFFSLPLLFLLLFSKHYCISELLSHSTNGIKPLHFSSSCCVFVFSNSLDKCIKLFQDWPVCPSVFPYNPKNSSILSHIHIIQSFYHKFYHFYFLIHCNILGLSHLIHLCCLSSSLLHFTSSSCFYMWYLND